MFGFSLTKLLFTAAIIAAVWYGFKWLGRMQERKDELAKQQAKQARVSGSDRPAEKPASKADPDVEEMVECSVCGAFVSVQGAVDCGKPGCPY